MREKRICCFGEDDEFECWIATQYQSYYSDSKSFHVFYVNGGGVGAYYLYNSNGYTVDITYAVRPVVVMEY